MYLSKSEKGKIAKKHKYMAVTMLFGLLITSMLFYRDNRNRHLYGENELYRNESGEGEYDIDIVGKVSGNSREYKFHIDERIPHETELKNMADEAASLLWPTVLGSNDSYESICRDLSFPQKLEGYPFILRWNTSDEDRITHTGKVYCEAGDTGKYEVTVKVVFIYRDFRCEFNKEAVVVSPDYSDEEMEMIMLEKSIKKTLEETRNNKIISLPDNVGGIEVDYSEKPGNSGLIMLFLTCVMTLLIGWAVAFDEKRNEKRRFDRLEMLYPGFVEKIKLYILSGMSVRNCFFAIRESLKSMQGKDLILLDELDMVCNRYSNGISEEKIITDFGIRCGEAYRRFCFLLTVNLKQGNDRLTKLLDEEVSKAFAMRRERARTKGEEASVKLLFPMLMMLLVVLVLIILPAYMKFN